METAKLIRVDAGNVDAYGFFCSKNKKDPGYQKKRAWLTDRFKEGLKIHLLQSESGNDLGFIESVPGAFAWRPVEARDYLFIHCIYIARKEHRESDNGSTLVQACIDEARKAGMLGVAVACSEGAWIAGKSLFQKNGFEVVDQHGRFELLALKFSTGAPSPRFIPWEQEQARYTGLHIVFAHQCPWHEKACRDLAAAAAAAGIPIQVTEITSATAAQKSPSGFGTFALLYNGKLLEDHYVSATRFKTILKEQGLLPF